MSHSWEKTDSNPYADLQDAMRRIQMAPWQQQVNMVMSKQQVEDAASHDQLTRVNARLRQQPWTA